MILLFWGQVSWRGNGVSGFSLLAKSYLQIFIGRTWKRSVLSLFSMLSYCAANASFLDSSSSPRHVSKARMKVFPIGG